MKKILLGIILLLFITGCEMKMDMTPSEAVANWMTSHQERNDSVVKELDDWLDKQNLDNESKSSFKTALEKQYQNLSYEILEEDIDKDKATVVVEIEVLDYYSSFEKSRDYFEKHLEEFFETVPEGRTNDSKELRTYQIKGLENVEDKTKYQITFDLTKDNNTWKIDDTKEDIFMKMYGLY